MTSSNEVKKLETGETKEEMCLKQLKGRIQDVIIEHDQFDDDFYLLQWLKVQKLKVDKAEGMLRAAIKWRKERYYDYDTLADTDFPSDIDAMIKMNFDGVTKDGVPVLSIRVGGCDFRGAVEKFGREKYIRHWVQIFAKTEKLMITFNKKNNAKIKKGEHITSDSTTGVYGVIDFTNYSFKQTQSIETIQCQIEMLKILSNYYPGIFGHGFIINASKFFFVAFKAVKPFLEGPCLNLQIFDNNEEVWKAAIYEHINPENLRPEFGGTM